MLLAVDVGNSETVVGLFAKDDLVLHWRLTSSPHQTGDELSVLTHALLRSADYGPDDIGDSVVSSVVPELIPAYRTMGNRLFGKEPLIIDHTTVPELEILYHDPASVGADRLINALAVIELYGKPAIVVDLGTATTFDVIDDEGRYAGGVIAPGVGTAATALFRRGARLARVEIRKPVHVVGRTTDESMQSGIFYGAVGGVDALVRRIIEEQDMDPALPVVATGGLASAIASASQTITEVDETLTLTGLRLAWERHPGR